MKKIRYIVPYFGKLPENFPIWLISCEMNPTINWLIITDDKTEYNYPSNVEVKYTTFEDIKKRIQEKYDFEILVDRPWKLCDYRVAYGEIFEQELKDYDFWGYCDVDLLWGDIRKFITNDILEKYEKIGFQGHSTLYKNNKEVNQRYKMQIPGYPSYKEIFTDKKGYCFDENIICDIYKKLNIPYYRETNFAHLSKYDYGFFLKYLPEDEDYKNDNQIFIWKDGKLKRIFCDKENTIKEEEFMYIHFFCRPMTYKIDDCSKELKYVMYPDVLEELKEPITAKYIKKKSKNSIFEYYVKNIYYNRKKLTPRKIWGNIKRMIMYRVCKNK